MKSLTNQEVLNIAYPGIYKQGHKSVSNDTKCVYRTDTGSRCAIGMCITSRDYRKKFDEGDITDIETMIKKHSYFAKRFKECDTGFLEALQSVHDSMGDYSDTEKFRCVWQQSCTELASEWSLFMPKINE